METKKCACWLAFGLWFGEFGSSEACKMIGNARHTCRFYMLIVEPWHSYTVVGTHLQQSLRHQQGCCSSDGSLQPLCPSLSSLISVVFWMAVEVETVVVQVQGYSAE